MPPPTSKKQAAFFGAIAGGRIKRKGFSRKEARARLRGAKLRNLPTYVKKKRKRR